jgi:hypothetical protein
MFIVCVIPANVKSYVDTNLTFSIIDRQYLSSTTASMAPTKTPKELMFKNATSLDNIVKKFTESVFADSADNEETNSILTAKLAKAEKRWEDKEDECDRVKEKLKLKEVEMTGQKEAAGLKEVIEKQAAKITTLEEDVNRYKGLLGQEWTKNLGSGDFKQENQVTGKGKDDGDDDGQGTKRKAEAMDDDGQ